MASDSLRNANWYNEKNAQFDLTNNWGWCTMVVLACRPEGWRASLNF
jgi:hypothetical protein